MYWWHYVLVFCFVAMVFCGVGFYLIFIVWIKYYNNNPRIQAVKFLDSLKIDRFNIKPKDMLTNDWKHQSDKPNHVAYKVMPSFIGRAKLEEHPNDDFIEYDLVDGKKVIFFGLKNFDIKMYKILSLMQRKLNISIAEKASLQFQLKQAKHNVKKEVKDAIEIGKSTIPYFPQKSGTKK